MYNIVLVHQFTCIYMYAQVTVTCVCVFVCVCVRACNDCRCAFLHFCSAKRPKLKQENPSLSVGSLAKQLSSAWKLMTPEQKKPYDILAEKDKQRYCIIYMCIPFEGCGVYIPAKSQRRGVISVL